MTAGEEMSRKAAEFSHLPAPPNYLGPVEPDENILFSTLFLGKENQGGLWTLEKVLMPQMIGC